MTARRSFLARLGGVAPVDMAWHEKGAYPRLVAYLPLSTLTTSDDGADRVQEYSLDQSSGQLVFRRLSKRHLPFSNDAKDESDREPGKEALTSRSFPSFPCVFRGSSPCLPAILTASPLFARI